MHDDQILENIDNPDKLENLYRDDRRAFGKQLERRAISATVGSQYRNVLAVVFDLVWFCGVFVAVACAVCLGCVGASVIPRFNRDMPFTGQNMPLESVSYKCC